MFEKTVSCNKAGLFLGISNKNSSRLFKVQKYSRIKFFGKTLGNYRKGFANFSIGDGCRETSKKAWIK